MLLKDMLKVAPSPYDLYSVGGTLSLTQSINRVDDIKYLGIVLV